MTITKQNKLIIFLLVLFFSTNIPVYSQGGYQQPRQFENPYDQVLDKNEGGGFRDAAQQGTRGILGTTSRPLRGKVVVAPAGSRFEVSLISTLNSGVNRVGDVVTATVSSPLIVGSDIIIPPGSQVIGQVINAIPAKRFKAGAGGLLEMRFTSIQTPNGQRYPLSASVDTSQFKLQAGTGGSRLAMGVAKTAVGAGLGAALGTAIGAIAGGMPGKGAWSGAAIGGGAGALHALAAKGSELVLDRGTRLSVLLDQSLQVVVPQRN